MLAVVPNIRSVGYTVPELLRVTLAHGAGSLVRRANAGDYSRMQAAPDAATVRAAPAREKRQLRMSDLNILDCHLAPAVAAGVTPRVLNSRHAAMDNG